MVWIEHINSVWGGLTRVQKDEVVDKMLESRERFLIPDPTPVEIE
jgi:hypothetical protein